MNIESSYRSLKMKSSPETESHNTYMLNKSDEALDIQVRNVKESEVCFDFEDHIFKGSSSSIFRRQ